MVKLGGSCRKVRKLHRVGLSAIIGKYPLRIPYHLMDGHRSLVLYKELEDLLSKFGRDFIAYVMNRCKYYTSYAQICKAVTVAIIIICKYCS